MQILRCLGLRLELASVWRESELSYVNWLAGGMAHSDFRMEPPSPRHEAA